MKMVTTRNSNLTLHGTVKVLPLEDFVDSSCLSVEEVGLEVLPKVMALGGPSLCLTLSVLEVGTEVALTG